MDPQSMQMLMGAAGQGGGDENKGIFGNITEGASKIKRSNRAPIFNQAQGPAVAPVPVPGANAGAAPQSIEDIFRALSEKNALPVEDQEGADPSAQDFDEFAREEMLRRERAANADL